MTIFLSLLLYMSLLSYFSYLVTYFLTLFGYCYGEELIIIMSVLGHCDTFYEYIYMACLRNRKTAAAVT